MCCIHCVFCEKEGSSKVLAFLKRYYSRDIILIANSRELLEYTMFSVHLLYNTLSYPSRINLVSSLKTLFLVKCTPRYQSQGISYRPVDYRVASAGARSVSICPYRVPQCSSGSSSFKGHEVCHMVRSGLSRRSHTSVLVGLLVFFLTSRAIQSVTALVVRVSLSAKRTTWPACLIWTTCHMRQRL